MPYAKVLRTERRNDCFFEGKTYGLFAEQIMTAILLPVKLNIRAMILLHVRSRLIRPTLVTSAP